METALLSNSASPMMDAGCVRLRVNLVSEDISVKELNV